MLHFSILRYKVHLLYTSTGESFLHETFTVFVYMLIEFYSNQLVYSIVLPILLLALHIFSLSQLS